MARLILGLIAGVLAGGLTVGIVETIGHLLYPPPPGVDASDPEQLRSLMDQIPLAAKIAVIVAWAAGIFVGGAVAAFLARRGAWPAWAVAAILLGMAGWTMATIPHPAWMVAAAIGVALVFGWLAGRIGARTAA